MTGTRWHWRPVVVLVATVAGVALTVSLGRWQLSRAAQKEALAEELRRQAGAVPVDLSVVPPAEAAGPEWRGRRVLARGKWVAQRTVFLDNRQMNGRPGFYVVTPLRLAGREDAILVQRGWVPRDMQDRTRLPEVPTPGGEVEIFARMAPPPTKLYEFSAQGQGPIRQNLDLEAFARETSLPLWPASLVQLDPPDGPPSADGLARQWPQPAVDVHKHYGYAAQWFALAALIAGLYVWFQLLRPWLRSR
ncbi:MAG TPA: SURF1 family protein [Burkholderiaceae bacterium]|nr:SURF1 family protein [Burkholderiaceae bacterium]